MTFHLSHEEAQALWEIADQKHLDMITAVVGVLAGVGLNATTFAQIAATAGLSVEAVTIIAALTALGLGVTAIVGIASAIGAGLYAADWIFGGNGVDITLPIGIGAPLVSAPMVARQHGYWVAVTYGTRAKKVCDTVWDCLNTAPSDFIPPSQQ